MPFAPPQGQDSFLAGAQLNVAPHLIDPRGAARIENGLLNDDGSVYKRGGSIAHSESAFGSAGKFVWEGQLLPGRRTVVASSSAFGVFATDDKAITSLGGSGFSALPKTAVVFRDILWIGGGVLYGGSRKTADYSTGTVKVVKGSKIVTGSGTTWSEANVDVGMLFRRSGERAYVVAARKSNTEIELNEAYEGANAEGKTYSLKRLEAASAPYKTANVYSVVANRLALVEEGTLWLSVVDKAHEWEDTIFPQETKVENKHELEEGISVIHHQSLGIDKLLIFHTGGIMAWSNLSKPIVDGLGNSNHRQDIVSREIVLWSGLGVVPWRNSLVCPCLDQVYSIDSISGPRPLGDALFPLYRQRMEEGMTPGIAGVERDHYFLPVLDSSGVPQELQICRLDRPYSMNGVTFYPWTIASGNGALVAALAYRRPVTSGESPALLAAAKDGKIIDLNDYFNPSTANRKEHDGTLHLFSLTTRDYQVGAIARWRKLEAFYELWEGEEGEEPMLTAEVGTGVRKEGLPEWDKVKWDEFEWSGDEETEFELLEGGAPKNAGNASVIVQNEYVWLMAKTAHRVRYRLQCEDPVAKLVLRGIQTFAAAPGNIRRSRVR